MPKIFLTGATGVMGMAGLRHLTQARYSDGEPRITVLARDSKVNRRKLAPFVEKGVRVIWGDLLNPEDVAKGVDDADIVLHVGGMVSPMADWYPEKTYKVNTGSMRNLIGAALSKQERGERIKVVYIGSVSQYGNRQEGVHWGRTGDPINVATFDKYALSKCDAERMLAESGLKEWVSLRQTGIMYPRILMKGSDPISFHVPLKGCLEWVTEDESGKLLAAVADPELPADFWCRFYNIGGGAGWRLTNYDFVNLTLLAVGCPPVEKVFERNWFATRNFHGMWYTDSDLLDSILHFRGRETMREYLARISKGLPWYFRLAPLAPAWVIKMAMRQVASKKVLGPLNWISENDEERILASFGGKRAYEAIPGWDNETDWHLSEIPVRLNHGYDESKSLEELTDADIQRAAAFRGGKYLGKSGEDTMFECAEGHRFTLTPRTMLLGGHWCPQCLREISEDPRASYRQASRNPFLRQVVGEVSDAR
ncbi:MAG: NAD(P)-dependent oxidoreductase [Muribaculaceae bacterium]|nr:NAD(P)-dependent oxidoreductase [Muribaculaceae bacterium]